MNKIKFSEKVLISFLSQIEKFGMIETGGILLGFIKNDTIYIEVASKPGENAIHEEYYFKADSDYVNMIIDMEYANSDGKIKYLGEWHTHPEYIPTPSELDLISLSEITTSKGDFCIMVILGSLNFNLTDFNNCSTHIIKYENDDNFYRLN
tara:strand:+ start:1434 stop:1886 length:453 start_codon:yes stop_codon:yes gene_type:complete